MAELPFVNLDDEEEELPLVELPLVDLDEKPKRKKPTKTEAFVEGAGQGLTLGFGDELQGAIGAGLDWITGLDKEQAAILGEEAKGFGENYASLRDAEREYHDRLRDEQGGAFLAGEIAGAIASPANLVAPGAGMTGGALSRAGALAARGAAEGAVAGFGEGEGTMEEQLANAKKGAFAGGAFGGGLSLGGGFLGRALSNRRATVVPEEIMEQAKVLRKAGKGKMARRLIDANFTPLNMADPEGSLGKIYRNVVGLSYGGGGRIGKQESRALNRTLARFADEGQDVMPETVGTRRVVNEIKDKVKDETAVRKDALDRQIAEARATEVPTVRKPTKAQAKVQVDEGLAKSRAAMRQEQAMDALPDTVPQDIRDSVANVAATNPSQALLEMDKYWKPQGSGRNRKPSLAFAGVREHAFDVDDKMYKFLKNKLSAGDTQQQELFETVEELYEAGERTLPGELILELRNQLARKSGGKSGWEYGKLRKGVKDWDTEIERQLRASGNKPALNQFKKDKAAYGDYRTYENSVAKSINRADDPNALFNEKDLFKSGGNKTQRLRQQAPGQSRAKKVMEEKRALEKAVAQQQEQAQQAAEAARKAAKEGKQQRISRLENRKKRETQRQQAALNRINRASTGVLPEDSTFWSRAAATAGLGAPLSGFSPIGAFPAGVATSTVLASPKVQRFLAGQGPMQEALRNALEAGDTARVTQILTRIGAFQSVEE